MKVIFSLFFLIIPCLVLDPNCVVSDLNNQPDGCIECKPGYDLILFKDCVDKKASHRSLTSSESVDQCHGSNYCGPFLPLFKNEISTFQQMAQPFLNDVSSELIANLEDREVVVRDYQGLIYKTIITPTGSKLTFSRVENNVP